jgi:hypothetical protein
MINMSEAGATIGQGLSYAASSVNVPGAKLLSDSYATARSGAEKTADAITQKRAGLAEQVVEGGSYIQTGLDTAVELTSDAILGGVPKDSMLRKVLPKDFSPVLNFRKNADLSLFTPKGLYQAGSEISSDIGQLVKDFSSIDLIEAVKTGRVKSTARTAFPMTDTVIRKTIEKTRPGFEVAKGVVGKGIDKAGQLGAKAVSAVTNTPRRIMTAASKAKDSVVNRARKFFGLKSLEDIRATKKLGNMSSSYFPAPPVSAPVAPAAPVVTPPVKPPIVPAAPAAPVVTPPVKPPIVPAAPAAPVVTPPVKPPVSVPTVSGPPRKSGLIDFVSKKASDLYGTITGKTARARKAALAATEEALDLVEYSDDAKRYMSTLSKEQLASFRELARNGTSTEKQAKLMKDSIEAAAKSDLRFIEGDDFLKRQEWLVENGIITKDEALDEIQTIRGTYSGSYSGEGRLQPRIEVNPTIGRETTRLHELTHFADDVTGHLHGKGRTYTGLQEMVGPGLEKFLDGPEYAAITDALSSTYTGTVIRDKPQELITILTQGKVDEASKHLFTEGSTAQEVLNKLWQARGYQSGGIIYAANGALIPAMSRGTDTVPAMLTPGEFVVNRQATMKHMPLLNAINSGQYTRDGITNYLASGGMVAPRYYAAGNVVSNSGGVSNNGAMNLGGMSDLMGQITAIKETVNSLQNFVPSLGEVANTLSEGLRSGGEILNNASNNIRSSTSDLATMPTDINITQTSQVNVAGIPQGLNDFGNSVLNSVPSIAANEAKNFGRQVDKTQFEGGQNTMNMNTPMGGGGQIA